MGAGLEARSWCNVRILCCNFQVTSSTYDGCMGKLGTSPSQTYNSGSRALCYPLMRVGLNAVVRLHYNEVGARVRVAETASLKVGVMLHTSNPPHISIGGSLMH